MNIALNIYSVRGLVLEKIMNNVKEKIIVISAINLRSGGTLSILEDCLQYLDKSLSRSYKILALVHNKSLIKADNIELIEFKNSVNSYLLRLYYEYIYFYKLSVKLKPYLWLSLHDISPNVKSDIKAVYCHNASPFYSLNKNEIFLDPKMALFSLFYKYIYKINISKNDYIIVQQEWIRNRFKKIFNVKNVIVAYPQTNKYKVSYKQREKSSEVIFFYPSLPRIFKNFEIIGEASKILCDNNIKNFNVILTIDGTENRYSRFIYKKYGEIKNIKFIGLQTREEVFKFYAESDCLLFPSKLETWGLPITEGKLFNKPILVADLEYAHETVGDYDKVCFFDPNDAYSLSKLMMDFINGDLSFSRHKVNVPSPPFAKNWEDLFSILLADKE